MCKHFACLLIVKNPMDIVEQGGCEGSHFCFQAYSHQLEFLLTVINLDGLLECQKHHILCFLVNLACSQVIHVIRNVRGSSCTSVHFPFEPMMITLFGPTVPNVAYMLEFKHSWSLSGYNFTNGVELCKIDCADTVLGQSFRLNC